MAKLGVAYGLCPLIDQASLLGVSEDSALDCVIVTIGKNIVIRYKLQDQKQVSSWSTKDKLTSQVIYNKLENQYFGIFNHNQLRFWSENDENLDNLKKYKFQSPIFSVLSVSSDCAPIIVFRSGSVQLFDAALKSRKYPCQTIIKSNESIEETYTCTNEGEKYVILLTSDKKKQKFLYIVPLAWNEKFERICLHRSDSENAILKGCTVSQEGNDYYFYTLWSDSRLYSFRIMPGSEQNFPGTFVYSIQSINSSCPAVLVPLSSTHMVIYGADPSEEGAMMILLNLQFQLIQSRLHFKLFGAVPRVWKVGTNLLLAVGHNLVVVPSLLDTEHLSTLVGSHKPVVAETGLQPVAKVTWIDDSQEIELFKSAPLQLKSKLAALASDGWPESIIFSTVLPQLLEKRDIEGLLWCIKNFSDISEDNIVQMLTFCLNEPDVTFKNCASTESNMDIDSDVKIFTQLQPEGRACIIEAILAAPISDACLVPHLRLIPLSQVLKLLKHLAYCINCNEEPFIIDWMCALLDAHYQQLILSKDPEVLMLLTAIRNLITDQLTSLDDFKKIAAIIPRLKSGKPLVKQSCFSNKTYSIEMLQLY